jgi:NADPH-dependent 2,4-dienoyl-CoA reductase/sulfur reductase-like enzyme
VTVIEAQPRLLPTAEPEAGDLLAAVLAAEGIDVRTGIPAASVSHDGRQFTVSLDGEEVTVERLLVATGRRTRLAGLGVAALGLDPAARTITVDKRMRASEGLWAIGDVTGVSAHTHMNTRRLSPDRSVHAIVVSHAGSPIPEVPKSMTALSRPEESRSRFPGWASPWNHTGRPSHRAASASSQTSAARPVSI